MRGFVIRARDKVLKLGERTALMGVVNVTSDSFYPGSRFPSTEEAVAAAHDLIAAGADIVDLGAESTRPGATEMDGDAELSRLLPVLEALRPQTDRLISVDTRKASVAERVLDLGADIINDVSALGDGGMAAAVARAGAAIVLMHMKGVPETMQERPHYEDVVAEVKSELERAVRRAEDSGIAPASILVDPGIGFGKSLVHNLTLLNRLSELHALEKPLLVGTSRKSFIGGLLGQSPENRIFGTAASVALAIARGAHIVRVHDVKEMREVAIVTDAIRNERQVQP